MNDITYVIKIIIYNMFDVQKYFEKKVFWFWRLQNTKYMQKSNLNTNQSINTEKVFKILNTEYIHSILSSNLNTCILNTDQHCWLWLGLRVSNPVLFSAWQFWTLWQVKRKHDTYSFITLTNAGRFLPRCMECRRGLAMRILSVRPSVCPSHEWIVTKRKKDLSRFI